MKKIIHFTQYFFSKTRIRHPANPFNTLVIKMASKQSTLCGSSGREIQESYLNIRPETKHCVHISILLFLRWRRATSVIILVTKLKSTGKSCMNLSLAARIYGLKNWNEFLWPTVNSKASDENCGFTESKAAFKSMKVEISHLRKLCFCSSHFRTTMWSIYPPAASGNSLIPICTLFENTGLSVMVLSVDHSDTVLIKLKIVVYPQASVEDPP